MHDKKVPEVYKLSAKQVLERARLTLHEMWMERKKNPARSTDRFYYEPETGFFWHNCVLVHPSVAMELIKNHLEYMGIIKHQGEFMIAYRIYYYDEHKYCEFESYWEHRYE
jgi:hypothetical protein